MFVLREGDNSSVQILYLEYKGVRWCVATLQNKLVIASTQRSIGFGIRAAWDHQLACVVLLSDVGVGIRCRFLADADEDAPARVQPTRWTREAREKKLVGRLLVQLDSVMVDHRGRSARLGQKLVIIWRYEVLDRVGDFLTLLHVRWFSAERKGVYRRMIRILVMPWQSRCSILVTHEAAAYSLGRTAT